MFNLAGTLCLGRSFIYFYRLRFVFLASVLTLCRSCIPLLVHVLSFFPSLTLQPILFFFFITFCILPYFPFLLLPFHIAFCSPSFPSVLSLFSFFLLFVAIFCHLPLSCISPFVTFSYVRFLPPFPLFFLYCFFSSYILFVSYLAFISFLVFSLFVSHPSLSALSFHLSSIFKFSSFFPSFIFLL